MWASLGIFVPSIPYEQIIIKARSKFMGYA